MKNRLFYILPFVFLIARPLYSQYNGKDFSISVNYNYTTTSKLFLQPNTPDPLLKNIHEDLDGINSFSGEFRFNISESLIIGAGTEYIQKDYINHNYNLGGIRASIKDGYRIIPLEFSLYYLLPFSTELFKFFMGGGGGIYFAEHVRELGDVTVSNDGSEIGYGIHVAVGMDYIINDYFSVRGQMRFRDPEIDMKSKYSNNIVNYEGRTFQLSSQNFYSKVNVDGITFTIGAVFNF